LNPSSLERDRSGRETLQSIGAKGPGNLPSPAKACGLFVLYSLQGMEFVRFMKRRHFINGLGATLVWPGACAIAATRCRSALSCPQITYPSSSESGEASVAMVGRCALDAIKRHYSRS
jgi:hypothetical protein